MGYRKKKDYFFKYAFKEPNTNSSSGKAQSKNTIRTLKSTEGMLKDLSNKYRVSRHAVFRYLTRELGVTIEEYEVDRKLCEKFMPIIAEQVRVPLVDGLINMTVPLSANTEAYIKNGVVVTVGIKD